MEEPEKPGEPITYVGGLGEPPKGRAWPFILLATTPVLLVAAGVVFWNAIQSAGHRAGAAIAPYSIALTGGAWSAAEKIAGVPISFTIEVSNTDKRAIDGLTMTFTRLDPGWSIVGASSSNQAGQIKGKSIFFPARVSGGKSTAITVTLLPSKAMESEIDLTLTPARSTTPARIDVGGGQTITKLTLNGSVRDPVDTDADARFVAIYPPEVSLGSETEWAINVTNTGPVAIDTIRLSFPDIPPGFQFRVITTDSNVLADGRTVLFGTKLPPGAQTILQLGVLPEQSGHYQIPVVVYLGHSATPYRSANGGPQLSIDVTVS
jgi:hypothetical protein